MKATTFIALVVVGVAFIALCIASIKSFVDAGAEYTATLVTVFFVFYGGAAYGYFTRYCQLEMEADDAEV